MSSPKVSPSPKSSSSKAKKSSSSKKAGASKSTGATYRQCTRTLQTRQQNRVEHRAHYACMSSHVARCKFECAALTPSAARRSPLVLPLPLSQLLFSPAVSQIVAAIKSLKVRGGASRQAITAYIEANHKGGKIQKGVIARAFKKGQTQPRHSDLTEPACT